MKSRFHQGYPQQKITVWNHHPHNYQFVDFYMVISSFSTVISIVYLPYLTDSNYIHSMYNPPKLDIHSVFSTINHRFHLYITGASPSGCPLWRVLRSGIFHLPPCSAKASAPRVSRNIATGNIFNGHFNILQWRLPYKAIFCEDTPLHRPYIGLIYGRYLQFRFLKWPLIYGNTMGNHGI